MYKLESADSHFVGQFMQFNYNIKINDYESIYLKIRIRIEVVIGLTFNYLVKMKRQLPNHCNNNFFLSQYSCTTFEIWLFMSIRFFVSFHMLFAFEFFSKQRVDLVAKSVSMHNTVSCYP